MNQEPMDKYHKLANLSYLFNDISGASKETSYEAIEAQLVLVKEEVKELADAVEQMEAAEVMAEAIDVLVVTMGLLQKLEALGFDVDKACQRIGQTNLTKFPTSLTVVDESVKMYEGIGVKVTPTFDFTCDRWVLRDENGKVRKPVGFKKATFDDCWPVTKG